MINRVEDTYKSSFQFAYCNFVIITVISSKKKAIRSYQICLCDVLIMTRDYFGQLQLFEKKNI